MCPRAYDSAIILKETIALNHNFWINLSRTEVRHVEVWPYKSAFLSLCVSCLHILQIKPISF